MEHHLEQTGEIVMYQPDETIRLEVRMEGETVWLTQAQMAELFDKDRTVIGRHIRNIYKEEELEKDITCAKFAHMKNKIDFFVRTSLPPVEGIFYDGQIFDAYRFVLIDDEVYHIGASIKDLGKKWFAFTLMHDIKALELVEKMQAGDSA